MRFTCSNCNSSISIPDEKLPESPRFKVKCPHCKELVVLDKSQSASRETAHHVQDHKPTGGDMLSSKPLEPEIFPPGARVYFHLVENEDWREEAQAYFTQMGYHESTAHSAEEARMKIRLNDYHLIFLDDRPDCELILQELSQWPGNRRRSLNVILLGSKSASLDSIAAFVKGVNTYINTNDFDKSEELFSLALKSYDDYYRYFFQASENS